MNNDSLKELKKILDVAISRMQYRTDSSDPQFISGTVAACRAVINYVNLLIKETGVPREEQPCPVSEDRGRTRKLRIPK